MSPERASWLVVLRDPFASTHAVTINGTAPGYNVALRVGPIQIEMNEQAARDTIRTLQDWLDDRTRLAPVHYNSSFAGTHRTNGEILLPLEEKNKLRADVAEIEKGRDVDA